LKTGSDRLEQLRENRRTISAQYLRITETPVEVLPPHSLAAMRLTINVTTVVKIIPTTKNDDALDTYVLYASLRHFQLALLKPAVWKRGQRIGDGYTPFVLYKFTAWLARQGWLGCWSHWIWALGREETSALAIYVGCSVLLDIPLREVSASTQSTRIK
jgi:hypothetical protein